MFRSLVTEYFIEPLSYAIGFLGISATDRSACAPSMRLEGVNLWTQSSGATPPSAQANINTVVALEEEAQLRRTVADRVSDSIANFVGSMPFVTLHFAWFGAWVVINLGVLSGKWKFDPYPFALLCMLVSLEGVLLSTFVLIKQNRMSQRADQRAPLGPSDQFALGERAHQDSAAPAVDLCTPRNFRGKPRPKKSPSSALQQQSGTLLTQLIGECQRMYNSRNKRRQRPRVRGNEVRATYNLCLLSSL